MKAKLFCGVIAMISAICVLFSSCGTSAVKFSSPETKENAVADASYHTASGENETVSENKYIELSIDKVTHAVSVTDKTQMQTWNALSDKSNDYAYSFGVTLYTKNGIYKMNTQDNSVAFSSSSYTVNENVLTVDYLLSDNEATAKKTVEEMTKDDIFVKFSVSFTLNEQSLYLDIDLENVQCTKGAFISDIEIMPFFGSSENDGEDDYFLIPDGSGAVMHPGISDENTKNVTVSVYGEDPCNASGDSASATLPVFGVKRGNGAFAAIITNGDALAKIHADRSDGEKVSKIYPSFTVTQTASDDSTVFAGAGYDGKITVVYKFLSGNNADYSGMASAAREEFIKNSRLSSSLTEIDGNIPFFLTVAGEDNGDKLTTTSQAIDILSILKGKGISNIVLNFEGLLSGGIAQKDLYSARINASLGGNDGLETLYGYANKQNCTLLLGVNVFSSSKSYITNASYTVTGDKASYPMRNDLGFNENANSGLLSRIGKSTYDLGLEKTESSVYADNAYYDMSLMNIEKTADRFQPYLEKGYLENVDGIYIADAADVLYSDPDTNRQDAMNTVSSLINAASNYGLVTVRNGNLYALYNAYMATNMNFGTYYTESDNYEAVPFVQSVLHGTVLYTGAPIDAGNPLYRYDMLRCIEYGALPNYEWVYSDDNIFCYSGYLLSDRITEIIDFYNKAEEVLTPLADKTVTDHCKITTDSEGNKVSGVYRTTYSDGTEIYVNYTGSIVMTADNITVGAHDFVSVKR